LFASRTGYGIFRVISLLIFITRIAGFIILFGLIAPITISYNPIIFEGLNYLITVMSIFVLSTGVYAIIITSKQELITQG
jgi:hypothetical protein